MYRMYDCDFRWPNGAYIAVVFNMSWETPEHAVGARPNAKYKRAMRPIYEAAFADTGGVQRLCDLWDRTGVRSSCYVDGLTVEMFPRLARDVSERGHEFLVQGWTHEFLYDMTVEEQAEAIARTNAAILASTGKRAFGFSSAGGHLTAETFSILAEQGFTYSCGLRNAEVPFIINSEKGKIVGMTSYAVSDTPTARNTLTPRDVLQMWQDYFDVLYEEGRRGFPKMLAYGTHPAHAHGHRIKPLEEVINYVKKKDHVWIATRGEIAEWVLRNYPDMDLSRFYPEAANSDRIYGLGIGLGGEEAKRKAASYRVS
ncbi:MAG: polysaccharide deacetylase family protein [Beijerinckiaceae bacterium]|jgi:peptidoglycan/xylan/chitin deacetylase (PgdA/CDA1 family)